MYQWCIFWLFFIDSDTSPKKNLSLRGKKTIFVTVFIWDKMTIFDDYKKYGACSVSPSLLWEYDLSDFDWWKSRKIVLQRILERGWLEDYYAGFNLYGGIEGFREIIKEIPFLSPRDMNFACIVFDLKKEDLKCYTRKLLREQLLNSWKDCNPRALRIFSALKKNRNDRKNKIKCSNHFHWKKKVCRNTRCAFFFSLTIKIDSFF